MNQGDIAEKILIQRKGEIEIKVLSKAVACVNITYPQRENYSATFWLFNEELRLHPNIATRDQRHIAGRGTGVAKNSRMGAFLIQRKNGLYDMGTNGKVPIEIKNFASYDPVSDDKYALNLRIEIFGIGKYTYHSLLELINYNNRNLVNTEKVPISNYTKFKASEDDNKPIKSNDLKGEVATVEKKQLLNIVINFSNDINKSPCKFSIDLTTPLQEQINKGIQACRKNLIKSEQITICVNDSVYNHELGFLSNDPNVLIHEAFLAVRRILIIHFTSKDGIISDPLILSLVSQKKPISLTKALDLANNDESSKRLAGKIKNEIKLKVTINEPADIIEQQKVEELNKIQILEARSHFIRSNNEMRMQHILDEVQDKVKRSRIFDGILVIDGGPGTGKTTTLIQRIKFLIDNTIVEYGVQYNNILDSLQSEAGWIFFSPSNLLLGYLRNAMIQEGLLASDAKSKVWANYINQELLRSYGLIGVRNGDKAPFKSYRAPIGAILPNDNKFLTNLTTDFESYLLNNFKENIEKSVSVISNLSVNNIYISNAKKERLAAEKEKLAFKNDIKLIYESIDLVNLIIHLDRFKEKYKMSDSTKITNESIEKNTIIIFYRLRQQNLLNNIYDLINSDIDSKLDEDDDESIIEPQLTETNDFIKQKKINNEIKKQLRVIALEKIGVSVSTKVNNSTKSIIGKLSEDLDLIDLGLKINFLINFRILNAGSVNLIFDKIPSSYSTYRNELFKKLKDLDVNEYSDNFKIVIKEVNQLHYDERNFIIYFINKIVRSLQKSKALVFKEESHGYISAYKLYQRYIIAIDEASDFSLIELACMHSFSHPDYNSTSLSGDIMQRLSKSGIQNWSSFIDFVGVKGDIKILDISYRQSNVLCNLAKAFYFKVLGVEAEYSTSSENSLHEPKPEVKQLISLDDKVSWISDKILEIFETYGNQYPSIAVFVPDDDSVRDLTNALNNDKLGLEGIEVKSILKDGATINKSQINVYNIETIKGLEFDTVFFC